MIASNQSNRQSFDSEKWEQIKSINVNGCFVYATRPLVGSRAQLVQHQRGQVAVAVSLFRLRETPFAASGNVNGPFRLGQTLSRRLSRQPVQ